MKEKIIVMGGSFNPPTIAHYRLMQEAIAAVGASKGIFVPVDRAYLKRKMRKAEAPMCLSEQLRMQMLQVMCEKNPMLEISDYEIHNPACGTPATMAAIQQRYPEAQLYFLAGADKMRLIRLMAEKHAFLERFGIAIVGREGIDPMECIRQDESLSRWENAFFPVAQPEGVEDVSSTAIRKACMAGTSEQVKDYLHEKVWEIFQNLDPRDYPAEIEKFKNEYAFLANSFPAPVTLEDLTFQCAEGAFQALRCKNPKDRKRFAQCNSDKAKSMGAKMEPREDWEAVKLAVMETVLRAKFEQNPELAQRLAETGDTNLIFGSNGKDSYWGMDLYTCNGENQLGRLLMKIRKVMNHEIQL